MFPTVPKSSGFTHDEILPDQNNEKKTSATSPTHQLDHDFFTERKRKQEGDIKYSKSRGRNFPLQLEHFKHLDNPSNRPALAQKQSSESVDIKSHNLILIKTDEVLDHVDRMEEEVIKFEKLQKENFELLTDEEKEKIEQQIERTLETLSEIRDAHDEDHKAHQIFEITKNEKIQGLLSVEIAPAHENGPDAFWLSYIVTSPDSRGQSRPLLLQALNSSEKNNFSGVIHVISAYSESDDFFKHFRFEGEQDPLILDPNKHPDFFYKTNNEWNYKNSF